MFGAKNLTRWARLAAVPLLVLACADDGPAVPPADAGPDLDAGGDASADADERLDGLVPLEVPLGDEGHGDVGAALASGQVRAGRVTTETQLLSGIKVEGRLGDFKLYNNRVAFIIEARRPSDGSAPFGGELIDAVGLAPRTDSTFGELVFGVGAQIVAPTSVGVVADGSDGQPAVVRVVGDPAGIPQLGAIGAALGTLPPLSIVKDYVLPPDSEVLEIRWRVFNRTRKPVAVGLTALGVSAGDGLRYFNDGVGFGTQPTAVQHHLLLAADAPLAGERPLAGYLLYSPEVELTPVITYEGLMLMTSDGLELPAAGEVSRRYLLAVTAGDAEAGRRALRRLAGEAEPAAITGVVRDHAGAAVAGARVHVMEASPAAGDGHLTMTRTDDAGRYRLGLAPGGYALRAVANGHLPSVSTAIAVTGAAADVDLELSGSATLRVSVTDPAGQPLPAKLTLSRTPPLEALPAGFGEPRAPAGTTRVTAVFGATELTVPPGEYSVTASRGPEHELGTATLTLKSGQVHEAPSLQLARSVDTTGWLCGDFHVHATFSHDSSDRYRRKVRWLAAEGVELPVITEHDYVGDLGPAIVALGYQPWLHGIVGEEISTITFGHFNALPLKPDPSRPNRGAFVWAERSPAELFGAVRAAAPDAVLQVNHPRSPAPVGYLTSVGYDPVTGEAAKIPDWSLDFDAMELFNAKRLPAEDWTAEIGEWLADWFSLLDRGLRVTATGNSDSHDVLATEVGYPRNLVALGTDEPAGVTADALAAAVKAMRVVVSGGLVISARVGDRSLGELAPVPADGKVELAVEVQAPSWVAADTLRVYLGGKQVHQLTLDATTADPTDPVVRYRGSLPLVVSTADSYVVVAATGSATLDPVYPGRRPFALTNPIFLDVDGNGRFDAPKER